MGVWWVIYETSVDNEGNSCFDAIMETKDFWENDDGVHLMGPDLGGEFTLCGVAFDCEEDRELDGGPLVRTKKKVVTCPHCIRIIDYCKGVKIKRINNNGPTG